MLNLKMLEGMGKTQVLCSSENEAKEFCSAMWAQYPDKMRPAWTPGQTNWNRNTTLKWYVPRIHLSDDDYVEFCQSANFRQGGYEVVLFKDLLENTDFGEFAKSEMDIKSLFGME